MDFGELGEIIKQGESENIEFKRSTSQLQRAGETLCGFLNGKGGRVFIGISPEGKIQGQDVGDKTQIEIAAVISKLEPSAPIDFERIKISKSKEIIILTAHPIKAYQPFTFLGRPYERIGSTTKIMTRSSYQQRLLQSNHANTRWEKEAASGYRISDLDEEEILRTCRLGTEAGRLPENISNNIKSILKHFGLIEGSHLLNAAIILFGKQFLPDFPQCQLRLAKFKGTNKTSFLDQKQSHGNAFFLLNEAMMFLQRHLPVAGKIVPGVLEREDAPLFPLKALREALVNAICHRCYEQPGGSMSIAIFDDRLEIWSSGILPFDLKPEDLKRDHSSHPRNPLITNVFYRRGLVEQWGRGTQQIIELCMKAGHPEPEFVEQAGSVVVRFLPSGYIPPHRISHDLTNRQRLILHTLSKAPQLSFGKIKESLSNPPKDRTLRDDFQHLKKLDLIRVEGKGQGAKWFLLAPENEDFTI